jgi:ABC-type Fe3+-siderophore transport system permease subunit
MRTGKPVQLAILAVLAWALAALFALKTGAIQDAAPEVIAQLRLPRVILAGAVGMGLAVSGAVLQALFSNPLCEPYTLGISSGSALGAVLGVSLGLEGSMAGLSMPAFAGALFFASILYLISHRPGAGNMTLLLAGVMLGFLGSSLVALWMALSDANGIQSAMLWLMGDLSRARLQGAALSLASTVSVTAVLWTRWRELDALLMGEEGAESLGVPVRPTRRKLILLVSVLIGVCVSSCGMIGFLGLVVPHFVRSRVGALHRALIPLSALWGAAVLTAADGVSRWAARPYELPVGVVTALVGAPLFLWIVIRGRREGA